jgi:hypothetical protein
MTVSTQVTWAAPMAQETIHVINLHGNELTEEGKEIGTVDLQFTNNQVIAIRNWVDEATALEWLAFVQPYGPVSATIIN